MAKTSAHNMVPLSGILVGALAGVGAWAGGQSIAGGGLAGWAGLWGAAVSLFGGAGFLAMLGSLPRGGVLRRALGLGLGLGTLLLWAVFDRFDAPRALLHTPSLIFGAALVWALSVPLILCQFHAQFHAGGFLAQYPRLYRQIWDLLGRGLAAGLVAGLIWGGVFFFDGLLQSAGMGFVGAVAAHPLVASAVTGGGFGLGAALFAQRYMTQDPLLPLKLLRLFAPALLVAVVIFCGAALTHGQGAALGALSPAYFVLLVAVMMIVMVSLIADETDHAAAGPVFLRLSGRGLAVVLPLPAILALGQLALRVADLGWTPGRLAAVAVAVWVLAFGLGYGVSALFGGAWMARVRRVNFVLASAGFAAALVWLTPLFDAQSISARTQVARYVAGDVSAAGLDLWTLRADWGWAGQAALARLSDLAQSNGDAALTRRLQDLVAAPDRWSFENYRP